MNVSFPPIAGIEDIEAIERVPLHDRLDVKSTKEIFERSAQKYGSRVALKYLFFGRSDEEPITFTYDEMFCKIRQTANLFHHLGVDENNPVSFLLPNLPQTHFSLWGAEIAGVVNPINVLLEADHIVSILNAAKTRVLVTLTPFPKTDIWQKVESLVDRVPSLTTILQIDMAQYLPWWQKVLVKWTRASCKVPTHIDLIDFDKAISTMPSDRFTFEREIDSDTIASLFHTGGTTGVPKLARHTHGNEVFNAWVLKEVACLNEDSIGICALPLFHVNAVIVTGLAPFLTGGTVLLLTPGGFRGPEVFPNFWGIIERYRVNFFSAVPTVFSTLLKYPLNGRDVSCMRFAITGAAPMPTEVFRKFESMTGLRIIEGYGQTEGTCASSCNPLSGEAKIGSIGLRFPYQQMKTVLIDQEGKIDRDCKVNEIGHVIIKGPNVFPGYTDPVKNEGVILEEGWINTGDLGKQDEDGYFWLTGRAKDIIIRGGHNIDPAIIEEVLIKFPGVELVAAVGQPDAHAGEVPAAYVQVAEPQIIDVQKLHEFAKQNISERAAIPVHVEVVDPMPVTPVGKIFKPALRHLAISRVYLETLKTAGIEAKVSVHADEIKGTLAEIKLADQSQKVSAQELLVNFTVPFKLN